MPNPPRKHQIMCAFFRNLAIELQTTVMKSPGFEGPIVTSVSLGVLGRYTRGILEIDSLC